MEKDVKKVKCSKCGFENIYGTKYCYRCHEALKGMISCPRCAKKNEEEAKKCSRCGYSFTRKKKSILFYLGMAILLVGVLFVFLALGYTGVIKKVKTAFRVASILMVILIFLVTFNYGKKDIVSYEMEEKVKNSTLLFLKKISNIAVIIGFVLAFIFICFYYFL